VVILLDDDAGDIELEAIRAALRGAQVRSATLRPEWHRPEAAPLLPWRLHVYLDESDAPSVDHLRSMPVSAAAEVLQSFVSALYRARGASERPNGKVCVHVEDGLGVVVEDGVTKDALALLLLTETDRRPTLLGYDRAKQAWVDVWGQND
jgi:hypothetical protein